MPDDKDLPSTFSVEYVRAWKTGQPSPVATEKAYVPEPKPVRTEILVGAHNCPLWEADKPQMWNQVLWSEGHYLAPHREYGFGYLDAVREVFSDAPPDHLDLLPKDVGMGPYDQAYQQQVDSKK